MKKLIILFISIYALALSSGWASETYDGKMALINGEYETALRILTSMAEQGDADAQYHLGLMYRDGKGVVQNYNTAFKWYTLAAEQGLFEAHINLGVMYAKGHGVIMDYVYAHMHFNIAASDGYPDAATNRDIIANAMTQSQIEKAQELARKCVAKNYKNC